MRRVSGEMRGRWRGRAAAAGDAAACPSAGAAAAGRGSAVAVAISDTIEGFDMRESRVYCLELLAQPLDVAVDGAIVDIDVLAIGAINELVAALNVAGAQRQRLEDEELGDGEIDIDATPAALVPRRVEHELAALHHRLALAAAARQLAAAQQGADALDQEALREWLLDVVGGAHAQAEHLVHLVVLRGQEDDRHRPLLAQMAEELHPVHARHL